MLGLFEEALIQYDEIDALLTQLVINSKFGGEMSREDLHLAVYPSRHCPLIAQDIYDLAPLTIASQKSRVNNLFVLGELKFELKFPSNNDSNHSFM